MNNNYKDLREKMVKQQIERREIEDQRVLNAFKKVPRHKFVPKRMKESSYGDFPLQIGEGQTISQPYIVAYMTDSLSLEEDDKVLEIGTGSGYQAAILAEIVQDVYTVEIIETLAKQAENVLDKLGYKNTHIKIGNGREGWEDEAPFDKIIVTAAAKSTPTKLVDQIGAPGKMIIPIGNWGQHLYLFKKDKSGKVERSKLLGVRFVPLTGE